MQAYCDRQVSYYYYCVAAGVCSVLREKIEGERGEGDALFWVGVSIMVADLESKVRLDCTPAR